jgi:hypothetical protein
MQRRRADRSRRLAAGDAASRASGEDQIQGLADPDNTCFATNALLLRCRHDDAEPRQRIYPSSEDRAERLAARR